MKSNKKFVILLEILVITFLVMSVVSVCGLSDSSADISAYLSIVNPGDEITVTYPGAPGFEFDGIAVYKAGEQAIYEYGLGKVLYFLDGKKSGTLTITAPDEPGDYEFRLFENAGSTDIARSNVVRVQAGTTVPTPTPTTLSGVHHLGDNTLSDWEVSKPEGTEYTTTFSLTAVPASADLTLDVFQIDHNDPVLVNGNSVGILCKNPIKSWKPCTIKIPGSALRVGSNTLTIQSESRGGNYDDFMIRNIGVTPSSGVHHLGDQTMSGWEVPKPEGTKYTTTFSVTAVPASADLILDVFDTDFNNPVLVNGNSVGISCINTIEGWKQCTIKIPGSALRVGSNTVTIQSESRGGNFDDFMIRNIEVTPSSKPYIDVVVDDVVIDFGRLDDKRRNFGVGPAPGLPRNHPVPFPNVNFLPTPGIPNWGVYSAPPVPGEINASTELKRLPTLPDPAHVDPTQYPSGMTCVYAIVADADGDAIEAEFVLPTPLFGRGNMYTAIPIPNATNPITSEIELSEGKTLAESFPDGYPIGAILDNYKVMEAYNAILTENANRGWLQCQPHVRSAGSPPRLAPFVAPIEPLRTPPREFPYVIGFNQGGIRNGSINPGDIVTEASNPLGLVPQGTVYDVTVVKGSWANGDAKGYLWMVPVTDDFWDQRHSTTAVPALFVNNVRKATCSYVGQTLPVIWEAPDDPDVEQTTHDRRHVFDPSTIISKGGTVNIEARVEDPFSPPERAFGLVAWPTPIPVENEADLGITKTDSSDPVLAGDNLAYTLTVSNNGPTDATEVVVADTLPTNIILVSVTPSQGRATESAGVVTWNVGDLVSGASATLTIIVTVSSSAEDDSTLTNTATVSAVETDPNTADNSDTETTTVNKEGDEDEEGVTTTPSTAPTITIPPGVHHFGDQNFTDWEVQSPEGTEYTTTFSLATVPTSADLTLDVFQTNYNNPVLVNGQEVGFLCIHSIESWAQCTISIPGSALQIGSNTLTIISERRGSNYDDFMIRP